MNLMKKFMKKSEGFTLVELIVVIAILAILAGVAVPAYTGYIKKANEASDYSMLDSVKTALVFEAVENSKGHACTVTGATVNAGSTEVTVTGTSLGDEGTATSMTVDVKDYVASITFKSGATSATWNGSEWTLVYPAG